jgi:hypothetical protein
MKRLIIIGAILAAGVAFAQAPVPSTGVWMLVKHVRFPIAQDVPIGSFPDRTSCDAAWWNAKQNAQFWTEYTCELRLSGKRKRR